MSAPVIRRTSSGPCAVTAIAGAGGLAVSSSMTNSASARPGVGLMEAATEGEFDVVLVWALDQVPHDRATDVFSHIAELMRWLVLLEPYTEPRFSSIGPGGERMLAIAAWIAALAPIPRECNKTALVRHSARNGPSGQVALPSHDPAGGNIA